MSELIERQAAINEVVAWLKDRMTDEKNGKPLTDRLKDLPPVQPEPHYDEWCDTCKEYDHERHCCPRWNHVIRTTLQDAQPEPHEGHWINGKCDRCGGHAPFWAMASTYYKSNFCPHCGAKMKGVRQK